MFRFLKQKAILFLVALPLLLALGASQVAYAGTVCGGNGEAQVNTQIDFGCKGQGNPIFDLTFGIIRIMSLGIGFVLVLSLIIAGIQYSTAGGNPQSIEKAKSRIMHVVVALLVYIFTYAFLNYIVPGGLLL